jgi:hypothetical protein
VARKQTPKEPEDMLNLTDSARYLKLTVSALSQAVKRGDLIPVLVSVQQKRFTKAALDAYNKSRSKRGRPRKSSAGK